MAFRRVQRLPLPPMFRYRSPIMCMRADLEQLCAVEQDPEAQFLLYLQISPPGIKERSTQSVDVSHVSDDHFVQSEVEGIGDEDRFADQDLEDCNRQQQPMFDSEEHARTTPGQTEAHMRQCPTCGKFMSKHSLNRHMRLHTGVRPFVCNIKGCVRSFAQKSNLQNHIYHVHYGIRPFTCVVPDCTISFSRKTTLLKHIATQHPDLQ